MNPAVRRFAGNAGVSAEDISRMIDRSARITHPDGNRRYHQWLFLVAEDRTVVRMTDMRTNRSSKCFEQPQKSALPALRTGEFLAYDECEVCRGAGCNACRGEGTIPVIRQEPKPRKYGVMT